MVSVSFRVDKAVLLLYVYHYENWAFGQKVSQVLESKSQGTIFLHIMDEFYLYFDLNYVEIRK